MRIKIKSTKKEETRAYRWAAMGTLVAYSACGRWPARSRLHWNLGRKVRQRKLRSGSALRNSRRSAGKRSSRVSIGDRASKSRRRIRRFSVSLPRRIRQLSPWSKRCENCWPERASNIKFTEPDKVTLQVDQRGHRRAGDRERRRAGRLVAQISPSRSSKRRKPSRKFRATVMDQQGTHHAARRAAQRGGHQPGGGRRRRAGRQPDHSRLHRAQRSVHRRHARFRQLLSRSVQHAGGGSAARAVVGDLRPRLHRRRGQPGQQDAGSGPASSPASLQFGTDLTRRVTLDINEPLPKLGSGAAFRLNLMGDVNDVAGPRRGREPALRHRAVAGAGTGHGHALDLQLFPSDRRRHSGLRHPVAVQRPRAGESHQLLRLRRTAITCAPTTTSARAKVEHDFNANITLRDQVRYANYVRDVLITEPQIAHAGDAGDSAQRDDGEPPRNRREQRRRPISTTDGSDREVRTRVSSGTRWWLASKRARETSDPTRPTWTNVPTTSLLDPDPDQALSGTATITSQRTHDVAHGGRLRARHHATRKHWDLTGGIRWDRFDTDYTQSVAPAAAFTGGRDAELARGAGLQAGVDRQHLLRRRHFVQSVGGIAYRSAPPPPICRRRRTRPMSRDQMGLCSSRLSLRARHFPHREDQRARARSEQSAAERSGRQSARRMALEVQVTGTSPAAGRFCRATPISTARWSARSIIRLRSARRWRTCRETRSTSGTTYRFRGAWKWALARTSFRAARPAPPCRSIRPPAWSRRCPAIGCSTPWRSTR